MIRRRLGAEDGIALPVALAVLLLCLILTATVATGADRLTGTAGDDQWGKRAFSAADAGVGVAVARLRALGTALDDTHCLTSAGVPPNGAGECPAYREELGSGSEFRFTVTPASTTANGCYEVPGTVIPANTLRRCITSTGIVNGEVRRVQAQVVTARGARHWVGILGLDGVNLVNSPKLDACLQPGPAIVASNVKVSSIENSSTILNERCANRSWTLSVPQGGGTIEVHRETRPSNPPTTRPTTPYVIDPPPIAWDTIKQVNNNDRILPGAASVDYFGNASFDTTARVGTLGNDGRIVLKRGGDFHICGFSMGNQGSIDFSTTERTRIFIDSPTRPGSGCPTGTGYFRTENSTRFNWPTSVADTNDAVLSARAKNVELYFHGNGQDLVFTNQIRFAGLIHAPTSRVVFTNSASIFGAVAARSVELNNGVLFRRPTDLDKVGGTAAAWASRGWGQCTGRPPVASDPESGC